MDEPGSQGAVKTAKRAESNARERREPERVFRLTPPTRRGQPGIRGQKRRPSLFSKAVPLVQYAQPVKRQPLVHGIHAV